MAHPSFVWKVRLLDERRRLMVVAALVLLCGLIGVAFALPRSGADSLAWWWPASGVGVAAATAATRRMRPAVLIGLILVTAAASGLAGRPLPVVLLGSIATAVEAWVVTRVLVGASDEPRLSTLREVGRFVVGALLGGLVAGGMIALGSAVSGGPFTPVLISIAASHVSAIVLIAPLALINRLRAPAVNVTQIVWTSAALVALLLIAFSPWSVSPLSFLPVPLLAWAAFTLPMFTVHIQLLGSVVLTSTLTFAGGGPFAAPVGPLPTPSLLQIYALALVATTLAISATRNERRRELAQQRGFLRLLDEASMRDRNGFAVLQEDADGGVRVVEANPATRTLLPGSFVPDEGGWNVNASSRLGEMIERIRSGESASASFEEGSGADGPSASVEIAGSTRSEFGQVFILTVHDLAPEREKQRELAARLEREREIAETLRSVNQEKDDFVASVTHELRTPITSIMGYAEELEDLLEGPERQYVDVIERNARRLLDMAENILSVSRATRSIRARDTAADVSLRELVDECLLDLQFSLDERSLRVDLTIDAALVVRVTRTDMTRVITNVLTNAIKFSPEGGCLRIVGAWERSGVQLLIHDDGPGISDADMKRVFEPFYRSTSAARAGIAGTGLGLPIVRDLLATMNGTIELSRAQPHGTIVTLWVPAPAAERDSPGRLPAADSAAVD